MFFSPVPMHIPDGFLSVMMALVLWVIAIAVVGYALKRVNADIGERQVPLMGVLAACIFAGQMLNFAVTGGTSGHLMGAALATILLGPWAAILVIACVVGVQALIFQDGGLLALGANIVNMGIIGVTVAYFAQRTLHKLLGKRTGGLFVGGFVSGWLSLVIAALACALELALSGVSPANIAVPAMAGIHALIGVGEGLITAGALVFLKATRRDLLEAERAPFTGGKTVWMGGLVIAVVLAILSPWASAHPDGLEWVAEQRGFLTLAREPLYAIIPDYVLPGVSNEALATILAGVIGALIVFGAAVGVAYLRHNRAQRSDA
ncbi:MAG TPA: energy-coupling factor ABC transporter permease [Anaerolineae bacterium]|nr:energy-coupling factor ABC transporter permease [Anaerolineae bacterium]HQH37990.1 energy-coupling factor ABC transporter permease [Anaerolineae bacterium]